MVSHRRRVPAPGATAWTPVDSACNWSNCATASSAARNASAATSTADEPLSASPEQRAIDIENRDVLEELDATARVELQQVEHALARIETGEYGRCEGCRRPIQSARLELVPFATRCAHCECTAEAS